MSAIAPKPAAAQGAFSRRPRHADWLRPRAAPPRSRAGRTPPPSSAESLRSREATTADRLPALASAPAASRALTAEWWFLWIACCRGVHPFTPARPSTAAPGLQERGDSLHVARARGPDERRHLLLISPHATAKAVSSTAASRLRLPGVARRTAASVFALVMPASSPSILTRTLQSRPCRGRNNVSEM